MKQKESTTSRADKQGSATKKQEEEPLTFYEALSRTSREKKEREVKLPRIDLTTSVPSYSGDKLSLGECFNTLETDLDRDDGPETVCLRVMRYQDVDLEITHLSLVVDLYQRSTWVLRQELDRSFFSEERFFALEDVSGDGGLELITQAKLGPYCAGCDAYRIYRFAETGGFVHTLNLFNLGPKAGGVKGVLDKLESIQEQIVSSFTNETGMEQPCGYWREDPGCPGSELWLLDSNSDGRMEIIRLLEPPPGDYFLRDRFYYLCILELSSNGMVLGHAFFHLQMGGEEGFISLIGFLETKGNKTHLLVNFLHPGTSVAYPLLHVFEFKGVQLRGVGEFPGFYLHAISKRLQDIDGDGNTEIIYLGDSYWPPGEPYAKVIPIYSIAEYRDGRYVEANDKFKRTYESLNSTSGWHAVLPD
ncbi:MAG: hypothetical protein JSU72_07735 [Deltaproteobacteria bacterium]|nr:MAG: hypothetical protein JSU72_07735 [Deltaproteobacteria bacterium]